MLGRFYLMRTHTIHGFCHVAVMTKDLKTILRKTILTQPPIDRTPNFASVFRAIIIYMVNCEEFLLGFSAAFTLIAISIKYFLTQFVSFTLIILRPFASVFFVLSIPVLPALITQTPLLNRTGTALSAHATSFLFLSIFAHMLCSIFSSGFYRLKSYISSLVSFLFHIRIAFKSLFVLNTSARLANIAKPVSRSLIRSKIFRRARFIFLALVATFLGGILRLCGLINRLFNWLSVQFIEIKCALTEVFWYNVHTVKSILSSSRPGLFAVASGQKHVNLTSSVYHKLSSFSPFSVFLVAYGIF